jgi:hypothetical protein
MEAVLKTFRELLRSGWPNQITIGSSSVPGVFNEAIHGWWHGERDVPSIDDLPAISIDPDSLEINWSGEQIQEKEYKFNIICYVRRDDSDDSLSVLNEIARLAERTIRKLSRWWVFDPCYFDLQPFIDPQYLINNYAGVGGPLTSYMTAIQSDFNTSWADSHTGYGGGSAPAAPTLRQKDLAASAYLKLYYEDALTDAWADAEITSPITGELVTVKNIINQYKVDERVPARFIGDCRITSISFKDVAEGQSLVRACKISVYAKEQDPVTVFGPL